MKIKLDENMPQSLVLALARLGHEIDTAMSEGLTGLNDAAVFAASQAAQRFFVTQDLDFSDLRRFAPGTHHGLMLIRLRSPGAARLHARVTSAFTMYPADELRGCFVVVSDRKIRVRRPPS